MRGQIKARNPRRREPQFSRQSPRQSERSRRQTLPETGAPEDWEHEYRQTWWPKINENLRNVSSICVDSVVGHFKKMFPQRAQSRKEDGQFHLGFLGVFAPLREILDSN